MIGEYEIVPKNKNALPTSAPGVSRFSYGQGRSVYASFDLALQGATSGDDSLFGELLVGAIAWVHPAPLVPRAGRVVPLEVTLVNQGQGVSGQVQVILPDGMSAVIAEGATVQPDGSLVYTFDLIEGETETRTFYVRLPPASGFATVTAVVHVIQGGEPIEHATTDLTIQVQP